MFCDPYPHFKDLLHIRDYLGVDPWEWKTRLYLEQRHGHVVSDHDTLIF